MMITGSANFSEEPTIVIDNAGKAYMLETARWSKFLGIVFCVVLGLAVLLFPLMMQWNPAYQALPAQMVIWVAIVYFLVGIGINAYPLYTLIQFSNKIKPAIRDADQQKFNEALRLMKNLYRYTGILVIIVLFIYGIAILLATTIAVTSGI